MHNNRIIQGVLAEQTMFLLFSIELKMKWCLVDLLVDQQIGTLAFSPPVFSSEAVDLDIMWVEFSYTLIIELNPSGV